MVKCLATESENFVNALPRDLVLNSHGDINFWNSRKFPITNISRISSLAPNLSQLITTFNVD